MCLHTDWFPAMCSWCGCIINSSFLPFPVLCLHCVKVLLINRARPTGVHEGGDSVSIQQHWHRFKEGCLGHSICWLTTLNELTCRRFEKPLLWVLADFMKSKTFKKKKNTHFSRCISCHCMGHVEFPWHRKSMHCTSF